MRILGKLIGLASLLIASTFLCAEQTSSRIEPLASESLLLDIKNVENKYLIAVGERGHILTSTDGDNWQQQQVPTQATLTRAFFLNEMTGWVVGHDATILKTVDGGKTWRVQMSKPELQRPLFDVYFENENHGIAVGAYGYQYRTEDGGDNWVREFSDSLLFEEDREYLEELKADDYQAYLDEQTSILPHFNRVINVDNTYLLAGEIGLIASSNARGKKWQKQEEFYQGSFFDIEFLGNDVFLVAGLRGNLFRKENEGTWNKIAIDSTALLSDIVVSNEHVVVLGNAGVWLLSSDNGKSFSKHVEKDGKALIAGAFFNNRLIISSEVGIKQVSLN